MRRLQSSFIFSLFSTFAVAQKNHWDGPQAKNSSKAEVINAQGTTNWVKFVAEGEEESKDAAQNVNIYFIQTAMLNTPRVFQDGDWVQVWTCTIVEPDTTNNLCYHGEYLRKSESELFAFASVYKTTSTPDITGVKNPKEVLAETGGFEDLGSSRLAWTEESFEILEITTGDWQINDQTTQHSDTTVTIGLMRTIEDAEEVATSLKGSTLAGVQGIWFKNGASKEEIDAITATKVKEAEKSAEDNTNTDVNTNESGGEQPTGGDGSRRLAGDGTIYAEQMALEVVFEAEEEEAEHATRLASMMMCSASLILAALTF